MEKINRTPNRLIHATSPYLLQHAYNPVDWFVWGEEALEKAKNEDKLLIVSIGYSACHWCHVMERESFENEEVAFLMNRYFISIKVDREERPDLDHLYMNAAMIVSQRGGWPLNAIALPDGKPVFAGTYFRKEQWMHILNHFARLYKESKEDLIEIAHRISKGIYQYDEAIIRRESEHSFHSEDYKNAVEKTLQQIDFWEGGINKSPKFPMPVIFKFLLQAAFLNNDVEAKKAVTVTLNRMYQGGIFDQIGGGFARYSTDEHWLVPHFEKMLYDNAQLISLYSEAWAFLKNPLYKNCIHQTIAFVERELKCNTGGYFSALDADSEGEEGRFYVWTYHEIEALLEKDAPWFCAYYGVEPYGNWEGKNILHVRAENDIGFANEWGFTPEEFIHKKEHCLNILLKARENRVKPSLDNKILTSWNGLLLRGYADAARYLKDEKYTRLTISLAEFLDKHAIYETKVRRRLHETEFYPGYLDDYSALSEGFLATYWLTGNEYWLLRSQEIVSWALNDFFDPETGYFFFTPEYAEKLPNRLKELSDNVIPASNSIMAHLLFDLGCYWGKSEWIRLAKKMLQQIFHGASKQWPYHANWAMLLGKFTYISVEVVISGRNAQEAFLSFASQYRPLVLPGLVTNAQSNIPSFKNRFTDSHDVAFYICQGEQCSLPIYTIEEALMQINTLLKNASE
ncbi:MAG: thioredoxin domain-containing protein [Flavobacteriales bacterium]|nr:thioredoxin domain-containing protein [Flavobacteriales bacterium]